MSPVVDPVRRPASPVPPRLGAAEAVLLQRALETLEDASAFALATRARIELLADRLLEMQRIAEAIADDPKSVEEREVACAKIELLAQQADVLARKPVHQSVPVLEGGDFAFEPPIRPTALSVEVPNLRSRGPGSLGLFEDVDAMFLRVGPGGAVLAGQEVPLLEPTEGDARPERLPAGRYRAELTYLALDASHVRLRLLSEDEGEALAVVDGIDLSPDLGGEEVDLGNGLALTLDRIPRSAEVEIETTTVQTLEWRRETGERLESIEGWFHETVQPRDFELYALFLERPLEVVRATREALLAFDAEVEAELDRVLARIEGRDPSEPSPHDPDALPLRLPAGGPGWSVLDPDALRDPLVD